jgi:hypothetical protein
MKKAKGGPGIWVTKDGREVPIKEMEDEHLLNTIRMLRRKGVVSTDVFDSCAAYAFSNNNMAAMAAEQELSRMYLNPRFDELLEELGRRGLAEKDPWNVEEKGETT